MLTWFFSLYDYFIDGPIDGKNFIQILFDLFVVQLNIMKEYTVGHIFDTWRIFPLGGSFFAIVDLHSDYLLFDDEGSVEKRRGGCRFRGVGLGKGVGG